MERSRLEHHFEKQAQSCDRLGSPFTARVCRQLAGALGDGTATARKVWTWDGDPAADALALRLCGALNALVLAGRDARLAGVYPPNVADDAALVAAMAAAIEAQDETISRFIDGPPQTNEIARSGMLLPGLLAIARQTRLPVALFEIGSSAGLNLNLDRFGYRYGGVRWGDPSSPVQLAPDIVGDGPLLDGELRIARREGCDVAPVDMSSAAARLRLRSYIWPDQPQRLARLDAALSLAEEHPFQLHEEDAASFVESLLATRRDGEACVLMHSIMWQYLPEATRRSIEETMRAAGGEATSTAPLAWLRMEPLATKDMFATLRLDLWPGDGQTRHLARCDYHGRSIEWL